MFYSHLKGHVEALLFASGGPVPLAKIAQVLEIEIENVRLLLAQLNEDLTDSNRGLTIVEVAGGYQLCTKPELSEIVERLANVRETKLSTAAMETVAVIAFKQPITKQEIEAIRGVKVDKPLATLIDRGLVRELGRKETIGRPILYGTTDDFLQCFGLKSLAELPPLPDLLTEQP
ncbi:Segregation and condensation protein B [bioreactor metagenome]|uniref:Segregation and condensation protein B n=1 Tax=bioreactor metagenome TaxID=1076179 RepID=A0A645BWI3_9ZZZZ